MPVRLQQRKMTDRAAQQTYFMLSQQIVLQRGEHACLCSDGEQNQKFYG
jgi:hypothetical protein